MYLLACYGIQSPFVQIKQFNKDEKTKSDIEMFYLLTLYSKRAAKPRRHVYPMILHVGPFVLIVNKHAKASSFKHIEWPIILIGLCIQLK